MFTFTQATTTATETTVTTTDETTATTTDITTGTETTSETTETETTTTGENGEEETTSAEETKAEEEQQNEEAPQEQENVGQPEPEQPAEPTYKYRNGEYEAEAEGYAGKVHVKLTIENDAITSITAWADDDDPEYFGDARDTVLPQIGGKVSADGIDACSGATFSSNGIIEAARKALEKALN